MKFALTSSALIFESLRVGALSLAALLGVAGAAAAETGLSERLQTLPVAITCEREGSLNVAYLSQVDGDGTAVYLTPTARAIVVSPDGAIGGVGGAPGGCAGQTIDALREQGLTLEAGD